MKLLHDLIKGESGQALLATLAMLTLSSLVIAPYLNFISTNLKAEKANEENVAGYYAAESGVEDGLWTLLYDEPAVLPHSYQLSINGMTVNVTIEQLAQIAGEQIGSVGLHGGWLVISNSTVYNAGVYSYTLSVENNSGGNMKIEKILVDLPPELEYITGSTSGDFTSNDPEVVGTADVGITVFWDIPSPFPTIGPGQTSNHYFQLSGPADLEGVEGHSFVRATREDVGTVWDADSKPYAVSAEARNGAGELIATIRAGVWTGTAGYMEVSGWRVNE